MVPALLQETAVVCFFFYYEFEGKALRVIHFYLQWNLHVPSYVVALNTMKLQFCSIIFHCNAAEVL